ncbi:alpha/beta hydrolase family protein [Microbacterium oleivorans]|uniref:alpha/beta hydrolase family protein n=1 Tax=Microbacterium oleivorans TaxID=273677 RepID=UPI00203E3DD7|nr:alpha/beta family hydrolase [Microbacterium oleivorans]MCM3696254.1 dienelactone hydrolase family protein [Microbacterium oleivorans]
MIPVALPTGRAEVTAAVDVADDPIAVVALAHGAGAGHEHPFLAGAARAWAAAGFTTVRFDFPYRQAGRRMPGPAAHAVETWAAVQDFSRRLAPGIPFVAAGKSYGGRMASMAAAEGRIAPGALLYLGYPLHPPGKPENARTAHLPAVPAPQLFLSGTQDPFLQPLADLEVAVASCRDAEILWFEGARHSFEVAGRALPAEQVGAATASAALPWLRERLQRPAA